ncbi:dipeptide ABC transporter ATP-binding protein [Williamsia soli]|uniref:dipeptide ABC transporter ATP-binding protein n=1 Tax=Williamsia soli TaxID=364929 RepID=UPI001A9D61A6|nr:ABC transporter ATP-binding protein [Williamsia soli]
MTTNLTKSSAVPAPREYTGDPIVDIRGLNIGYVRNRKVVPAVHDLDLRVNPGEVVAVVGESGSGKTTTANAIIGLLPANGRVTSGSIKVGGVEIAGAKEKVVRRLRGSVVGLIPQDPMVGLNPTQRIGVQVAEAAKLRGIKGPQIGDEVVDALGKAGLDNPSQWVRRYPHELSGGQRQRVLIAIALAGKPDLIIADEPTSALDVTVQARILDHLESLVRDTDTALLIITHDLAVAADRSDRVIVMQHGRIVEQGSPSTILVAPEDGYTQRLIAAAPALAHGGTISPRFVVAAGDVEVDEPIIELTSVSKDFHISRTETFTALDDISVRVAPGRTHALVGESGSGKTTTLRIAMGLEKPTSGTVRFAGTDITELSWRDLRPLRRRFQLVHQDPFASLDPRFTVRDSIIEPLVSFRIGDRNSRNKRASELLEQVGLPQNHLDRLPVELSGGQRQRVAIARSLVLEPEVVLLDEPVSALDVSVQEQILELLTELQERLGLTYVFISHDLAVVAQVAHTVSVFEKGKIVESGSVAKVFREPTSSYTQRLLDAIPGKRAASRVVAPTL